MQNMRKHKQLPTICTQSTLPLISHLQHQAEAAVSESAPL
jgi:hypothetical protein